MAEQVDIIKLNERLQRFCELRGLQVVRRGQSTQYCLDNGVELVISDTPKVQPGLSKTWRYYGEIVRTQLRPGSLGRWRYLDEKNVQYMFKILDERIEILERRLKENEV